VQDEAAALVLVAHLIEHAKSQGYRSTAVSELTMRTLAPELAELGGVFVRYDESGAQIARFGFTYIVRGGSAGWRIVVALAHDARTETTPLSPAPGD
jgi:hypothetical protein